MRRLLDTQLVLCFLRKLVREDAKNGSGAGKRKTLTSSPPTTGRWKPKACPSNSGGPSDTAASTFTAPPPLICY